MKTLKEYLQFQGLAAFYVPGGPSHDLPGFPGMKFNVLPCGEELRIWSNTGVSVTCDVNRLERVFETRDVHAEIFERDAFTPSEDVLPSGSGGSASLVLGECEIDTTAVAQEAAAVVVPEDEEDLLGGAPPVKAIVLKPRSAGMTTIVAEGVSPDDRLLKRLEVLPVDPVPPVAKNKGGRPRKNQ